MPSRLRLLPNREIWARLPGTCSAAVALTFFSLLSFTTFFLYLSLSRHFDPFIVTMAEKEATVYIVDVGKSMGERRQGRSVTDLEWAMRYVWDRISATVYISCSDGKLFATGG